MSSLTQSKALRIMDDPVRASNPRMTDEQGMERNFPASLSLDTRGLIRTCAKPVEEMFGYRHQELIWQHISRLFPKFSEVAIIKGGRLNPLLNYLCHCDHPFDAMNKQGEVITCNLNLFLIENNGQNCLRLIVRPLAGAKQ